MEKESAVKVSVIMPVYNAQDYLGQALKDVVNQTLQEIEIICVDDGSTDASRQIIGQFTREDGRIRLVEQQNSYAGAARNHGLEYATGKYVVFWDSDDMFRKEALETLYLQAERQQADICICAADRYDNKTKKCIHTDAYLREVLLPNNDVFSKSDVPDYIFNLATNVPWNKMFLHSFIETNGLRFQEIRQANDTYFTLMAFFLAKRITCVKTPLISYRVNNSASLSGKASDTVFCAYDSYAYTLERMKQDGGFGLVERSFRNRAISGFYHAMNIQTTFEGYRKLYVKLVQEGFARFGLLEQERDFFYDKWMYDDLHQMLESSPEDFLLQKSMSRRLTAEKGKGEQRRLRQELEHETEAKRKIERELGSRLKQKETELLELRQQLEKQRKQEEELRQSFSFRLGRTLTWPVRKLKDREKVSGKRERND